MNPTVTAIIAAAATGLAVLLLIWGGRGWLAARFARDVEWMRITALRFSPEPIDPRRATIALYLFYVAVLLGLTVMSNVFIALIVWLVLLLVPRIVAEAMWKRRREEIDQQLPLTIATMCNSLRAGLTLVQAIQRLGEQAPEPIRTEFKIMANRYSYGADLVATIAEAKSRLDLPNFNLFASALLLNREMGGDVGETLNRISQSLDRLQQMRQTVEAHTSEGRTNIKVLLVSPVALLLMLSFMDPSGVKMVFTTPQGYGLLLVVAALIGLGTYFARRITRSEV